MHSDGSPPKPHASTRSDMVDAHLVMNVLNQMAAQDFKEKGVENPLLYALSDYLRESLQTLGSPLLNLEQEARLLGVHAQLMAESARSVIRMEIHIPARSPARLPQGALARIVSCLLKSTEPAFGGDWRLQLVVEEDAASPRHLTACVDLQGASRSHHLDLAGAQQRLRELAPHDSHALHTREATWTQERPQQLKLAFRIALPA